MLNGGTQKAGQMVNWLKEAVDELGMKLAEMCSTPCWWKELPQDPTLCLSNHNNN